MPDHNPAEVAAQLIDWAGDHGFTPSDRSFAGQTPFLRLGVEDISGATFDGKLAGRRALLGEFFIASPQGPGLGASFIGEAHFVVLLCEIVAPRWPRITVHPLEYSDGDWLDRLLHREDHRVHDVSPSFDHLYRLRAADTIADADLLALFDPELTDWFVEQLGIVVDIENNDETGDSLVIATRAIDGHPVSPDRLIEQAVHLIPLLGEA